MELKLTGWKGVLALVVLIASGAFRYITQNKDMETQGVEKIQQWVFNNEIRAQLPQMQKAMDDPQKNSKFLEESAKSLQKENFIITGVKQHGIKRKVVAKVDVQYNGEPHTYYLRMEHSLTIGWQVRYETTPTAYYLALF